MEHTADKIIELVDKVEQDEKPLYDILRGDYRIWRGETYVPEDGYESYTDNVAQSGANKSIALMESAKCNIYVPLERQKKKRRKQIATTEFFFEGWLDAVNHLRAMRNQPTLQAEFAWQAYVRGAICFVPLIHKGKGGETLVDCQVWDRLWTRYQMGPRGLEWAAYVQYMTPPHLRNIYDVNLENRLDDEQIRIINFYCEEKHSRLIDKEFQKNPEDHDVGFNPVIVISVGAAPLITDSSIPDAFVDQGGSGFKEIRNLLDPYNLMMSAALTQARRVRKPPIGAYSADGNMGLDEDPLESGKVTHFSRNKQQDIKPLEIPELPNDFWTMAQDAGAKIQAVLAQFPYQGLRGDKPWTGLALNVAQSSSTVILNPFKFAMQRAFEEAAYSVTRQFAVVPEEETEGKPHRNRGLKAIELMYPVEVGMDIKKFAPTDIKPLRFKCEIEFDMPRNKMENWLIARIMREPGQDGTPLASDLTIMEFLREYFPDPDSEQAKKLTQWAINLPPVRLNAVLTAFLETMDPDDKDAQKQAMALTIELERLRVDLINGLLESNMQRGQLTQTAQGGPQPMQAPPQGMNPGAVMPMQGVEAGFAPPEALGLGGTIPPEVQMMIEMAGA